MYLQHSATHLTDDKPCDIVVRSVQDLALQEQRGEFHKSRIAPTFASISSYTSGSTHNLAQETVTYCRLCEQTNNTG